MNIKEMIYKSFRLYFVLVTCISAVILIFGMTFDPDARFGYNALISPFKYAALGVIPTLVMYSKNELSVKQIVIRKIIQLAVVEAEILTAIISSPEIKTDEPKIVISLILSILFVFAAANIISYVGEYLSAKKLTQELIDYQDYSN